MGLAALVLTARSDTTLLVECGTRLRELLEAAGDSSLGPRRQIIDRMLGAIRPIAAAAIEERAQGTLEAVFGFYERLHAFAAGQRFAWHELIEIDRFAEEIVDEAAEANLDEALKSFTYAAVRVLTAHLKNNVPPEDKLWMLQVRAGKDINETDPDRGDASNQWDHIRRRGAS